MVDIRVILDEKFIEPLVQIYTKSRTKQVESILYAIENTTNSEYPPIATITDGKLSFLSQRDIFRIQTEGRKVFAQTETGTYEVKDTLSSIEEKLDDERFFRISQSEIINLYKVSNFDFSISGTISVNFENGETSWVSRRRVKPLKDMLKNR